MIETLVSLLIALLILGLVYWAVITVLGVLPIPEPMRTIIRVILVLIVCLILIYWLVPLVHFPARLN